ncbi:MAG: prolyl oligopeptidase family serine peptidase [Saprospiraceae bacterium]|nr:prolyl oligopeptidase family serine peptidase [Saprospiraceae bacterium]
MNLNYVAAFLVALNLIINQNVIQAQKYHPGPQDLTFFSSVDETNQPYAIYIPEDFDETRKYPLVVFLHGAFSNHRLGLRRVFGQGNIQGPEFGTPGFTPAQTDLEVTRSYPDLKKVDFIAVAPFARGTAGYKGIPEQDVFDMLADVKSKFSIDEDRMYLTGLSMGGGGTLWIGLSRPDLWAAIAPVCPAPPQGTDNLAMNAFNLPVHLFVGDRDGLMSTSDAWEKNLKSYGVDVEYTIYPGIAHNSWEYAYRDGFIFDWFSQFKRNLFPKQVKFTSSAFKYNKAYWVTLDNLIPGIDASIDASFVGQNEIQVTTKNLLAFTLQLKGHPQFNADLPLKVTVGHDAFTISSPDAVAFSQVENSWQNRKFTPGRFSKQTGAEGPLSAAISKNHIYIYGTDGDPDEAEQESRRSQAMHAADWAFDRPFGGRVMIFPRALADDRVRQSDLEVSDLILFGTAETNSLIRKYSDRLPVELNRNATDYGLVYIFPINGHYVLINSGLPWWTPPASTDRPAGGIDRLMGKGNALNGFPDFILFKNTPDNVISKGYFDNNWRIPASEKSKLEASGVVKLK